MDYSISENAKYAAFVLIPFVFGARHILFGVYAPSITLSERIGHVALGVLECMVPFVACIEYLIHKVSAKNRFNVVITGATPYERGKQFGEKFREETEELYKLVLSQFKRDSKFQIKREQLLKNLSSSMHDEMQGLAAGAKVSFNDVVDIHTLVDIRAGQFGCSSLATRKLADCIERVVAANHFQNEHELYLKSGLVAIEGESFYRQDILSKSHIDASTKSHKKAIQKSSVEYTIQSIAFDLTKGKIHLATGWGQAAKNQWNKVKLFPNDSTSGSVKLVRNLDWPWMFLGPKTVVVKTVPENGEQSFVNVTFPGYLGVLSGMNQNIAIATNQSGSSKQNGTPLTLIFREVIQKAGSTKEALEILNQHKPASSMNLTIAGKDGVVVAEIDPYRQPMGTARLIYPNSSSYQEPLD